MKLPTFGVFPNKHSNHQFWESRSYWSHSQCQGSIVDRGPRPGQHAKWTTGFPKMKAEGGGGVLSKLTSLRPQICTSLVRHDGSLGEILKLRAAPIGPALNLRTITLQKCAVVSRRAFIEGTQTCVPLSSRLGFIQKKKKKSTGQTRNSPPPRNSI